MRPLPRRLFRNLAPPSQWLSHHYHQDLPTYRCAIYHTRERARLPARGENAAVMGATMIFFPYLFFFFSFLTLDSLFFSGSLPVVISGDKLVSIWLHSTLMPPEVLLQVIFLSELFLDRRRFKSPKFVKLRRVITISLEKFFLF